MKNLIQEFSDRWIAIEGVVAIGEGYIEDMICIHMYISPEFSIANHPIPESYKGLKIVVEETDLAETP